MNPPGDHVFVVGPDNLTSRIGPAVADALGRTFVRDRSGLRQSDPPAVVALGIDEPFDAPLRRSGQLVGVSDLEIESADGLDHAVETVLDALLRTVTVPLGERSYDVVVGPGARRRLSELLPQKSRRVALVTQVGIDFDVEVDRELLRLLLDDGEQAKSLAVVERLCRAMSEGGMTRGDVIVGVGGGVVTDVAGFVASCYHRGIAVVHVATTLLGQIDAAIGGKTGVNLPEGKNLVGAFWQPSAVICDTDALQTLPEREQRSGLGEMAKYAFLGVESLDTLCLVDQITSCVELKATVVGADEREGSSRAVLNYGHTLAHALEAAGFADGQGRGGIDLRHGEAVAIGIVFAAHLARALGRIDQARLARHEAVVASYGLSGQIPGGIDHGELIEAMGRDKKATDGLTFVLDGPNGVELVEGVDTELVRTTMANFEETAMATVSTSVG